MQLAISYFAIRTTNGRIAVPTTSDCRTLRKNFDNPEEQTSESQKRLAGSEVASARHRHRQRHRNRGYQGYQLLMLLLLMLLLKIIVREFQLPLCSVLPLPDQRQHHD